MKIIKLWFLFMIMGSLFQTMDIFSGTLRLYQAGTKQLQRQLPSRLSTMSKQLPKSLGTGRSSGSIIPKSHFQQGGGYGKWSNAAIGSIYGVGAGIGAAAYMQKRKKRNEQKKKNDRNEINRLESLASGDAWVAANQRRKQRIKRREEILAGDIMTNEDLTLFDQYEQEKLLRQRLTNRLAENHEIQRQMFEAYDEEQHKKDAIQKEKEIQRQMFEVYDEEQRKKDATQKERENQRQLFEAYYEERRKNDATQQKNQRNQRAKEILVAGDLIREEDRKLFTHDQWETLLERLKNKKMRQEVTIENSRKQRKAEEQARFEAEDDESWWPSQRKLQNKWTDFKNYWSSTDNSTE